MKKTEENQKKTKKRTKMSAALALLLRSQRPFWRCWWVSRAPSKEERTESAELRNRLIKQDYATRKRKDQSYANCRSNRNKDPSHQIPRGAAGYIGKRFVDADEPGELWEITDVYFSFADKEIVIDYRCIYNNCDPKKEQTTYYSSFHEFLLWPGLEVHVSRSARTTSRVNTKS